MAEGFAKARVVGITVPTLPDDGENPRTAEELVAYCARVSNPKNQTERGTAEKLLRYCRRNAHHSIFEMANATLEINAPRDISRQVLRHRSFSFQEFSQRYAAVLSPLLIRECRFQHPTNRQSSVRAKTLSDYETMTWWQDVQVDLADHVRSIYEEALSRGIAKECARVILPEGMTPSTFYMQGSLRSWMHYVDLRTGNGTQVEHVEVAAAVRAALMDHIPVIIRTFQETT